jgi:hypothetical protein
MLVHVWQQAFYPSGVALFARVENEMEGLIPMKKIMMTMVIGAFTFVGTLAFWAKDADAIPVFARKYGMSCNSCHTMFPKLSKMGVAFRERGFRFEAGKADLDMQSDRGKNVDTGDESPAAVFASNFPFTLRTQVMYSGAGPITDMNDVPVMPGHRMGMLDGALVKDPATGQWTSNRKIGFGELGLISSGAYDNFAWWIDANQAGIGMAEGVYYVNDLLKVRFGRVQNDVGYGMTMMSRRPLGFGAADAAQMVGGTMLMMGDGISIHGTTNGDSGVGTLYNLSAFTYGKNVNQLNKTSNAVYGRLAQEIADNYIVGVYAYRATNYGSDAFGGENTMQMAMGMTDNTAVATAMQFKNVTRYGVDFALNYGEPFQIWGAVTLGNNRSTFAGNEKLDVRAITVVAEYIVQDGLLFGLKWDQSRVDLKMGARKKVRPKTTNNFTAYGLYQLAQNVQGFVTYTHTQNLVTSMGPMGTMTVVRQQNTINTLIAGFDIAL